MTKATIAVVGRPNVGKSTLFNRLVGRQAAIVQDMPGVTRDRHYAEGECLSVSYIAIDTGGFEPTSVEGMMGAMREQAEIAMAEADVIIALYDGRDGLLPVDTEISRILTRTNKPVFHVVNKIDGPKHDSMLAEFYAMGVNNLYALSAQHGIGYLDLMEEVLKALPQGEDLDAVDESVTRVAVIGKPNAGKSTLVNRMLGEERLLVSDIPGTTRDAIDTWLERPPNQEAIERAQKTLSDAEARQVQLESERREQEEDDEDEEAGLLLDVDIESSAWVAPDNDDLEEAINRAQLALDRATRPRRYLLIDTAGIRRRKWIKTRLERVSIVQSFKSIDRSDVCLLLIDATKGATDQDAKLAGLIQAKGRPCVILVNKWDIYSDKTDRSAGEFVKKLRTDLPFVAYAPVVFISAETGQRTHRILGEVDRVRDAAQRRIPTGALNRFLATTVRHHQPPIHKGRRLRFYYGSQVAVAPPTFLFWVNDPDAVHFSYERFIHNRLREKWDFEGTPIKLIMRKRSKKSPK